MRKGILLSLSVTGLLTVVSVIGCGRGNDIGAVPVTGTVMMDGQPLAGAAVTFQPAGGATGEARAAAGITDASGKFELTTVEAGDGALPGQYQVAVSKTTGDKPIDTGPIEEKSPDDIDALYREAEAAGQYGPGAGRQKIEYIVPQRYMNPQTSNLTATVTESGENTFTFEVSSR